MEVKTKAMALESILLILVFIGVIYTVYQLKEMKDKKEIEPSNISEALKDSGLYEKVGEVNSHAKDIRDLHQDISEMLRNPYERGSFGEEQLEVMLQDTLPGDMYGLQEQVVGSKIPDAFIKTSSGKLCIDSKFPLENYRNLVNSENDSETRKFSKKFRKDVKEHLKKIKKDYIRPEKGTVETAFAFIPSESVYYYLVTEEFELLRTFSSRGVQVVSPLTLGHKMQLIKADIKSHKLSEKAERIKESLDKISGDIESFEDDWQTFLRHISNAKNKSEDVDRHFESLKRNFESVSELEDV